LEAVLVIKPVAVAAKLPQPCATSQHLFHVLALLGFPCLRPHREQPVGLQRAIRRVRPSAALADKPFSPGGADWMLRGSLWNLRNLAGLPVRVELAHLTGELLALLIVAHPAFEVAGV
jgi:hypothetical protein